MVFNGENYKASSCMSDYSRKYGYTFDQNIVNYLTNIESNYGCAGLCEPLNFYALTDVTKGRPTGACKNFIIQEYTGPKSAY